MGRKKRTSGRRAGGPIRIEHPGSLKKYGYDPDYSEARRHAALKKIVRAYGYQKTIQKLNAVRILTKNTDPRRSRIYEKDMLWLRKVYRGG